MDISCARTVARESAYWRLHPDAELRWTLRNGTLDHGPHICDIISEHYQKIFSSYSENQTLINLNNN